MQRKLRRVVAILLWVAPFAACKGTSADTCGTLWDSLQSYFRACSPQAQTIFGSRDRYVRACKLELDAPGAPSYAAAVDKCSATVRSEKATCSLDLSACVIPNGTLAVGAGCGNDAQCNTGFCQVSTVASACGKCAAVVTVGQPCVIGTDHCATNSGCVASGTPGAGTCTANTTVDIGSTCDNGALKCKPGARCDGTSKTCVALASGGASCTFADQCVNPLACAAGTCATGKKSGESCSVDDHGQSDCLPSLVCTTAGTCGAASFAGPGAQCDDVSTFCQKGTCVRNADRVYICPTIIADGQPCDETVATSQCDDDASCSNGACAIFNPATCK